MVLFVYHASTLLRCPLGICYTPIGYLGGLMVRDHGRLAGPWVIAHADFLVVSASHGTIRFSAHPIGQTTGLRCNDQRHHWTSIRRNGDLVGGKRDVEAAMGSRVFGAAISPSENLLLVVSGLQRLVAGWGGWWV